MAAPPGQVDSVEEIPRELREYFETEQGRRELGAAYLKQIRDKQPSFREAVWADAHIYSSLMMGPAKFSTRLGFLVEFVRLSWSSDAFFAMFLYRLRVFLFVRSVPILPRLLHRLSVMISQICIGDWVVVYPGVYIAHGFVVMDGAVEVGAGAVIAPWVSIGRNGPPLQGPNIGPNVFIGTGAKLLGNIEVGMHAIVAANSVVIMDVAPYTTVAGAPARLVLDRRDDPDYQRLVEALAAEDAARASEGSSRQEK